VELFIESAGGILGSSERRLAATNFPEAVDVESFYFAALAAIHSLRHSAVIA
jgi:hypothetical protein